MVVIRWDPLVTDTSQRLRGLSEMVDLLFHAMPDIEAQERQALKQPAERESWEYNDYTDEDQFLDVTFQYWLPTLSSYSVVILLSSLIETQLLAFATKLGKSKGSAFAPSDLKGSPLDRVALYVRRVPDFELAGEKHWKVLRDIQDIRDIIVHRAGKPRDKEQQVLAFWYQGVSLQENPYTFQAESELLISVQTCKYFIGAVEEFFKSIFKQADLPVETGLWPNVKASSS